MLSEAALPGHPEAIKHDKSPSIVANERRKGTCHNGLSRWARFKTSGSTTQTLALSPWLVSA
ncbi:hypothetical protein ACFQX4_26115, partial [Roseomonas sp. GCM10028921]